MSSHAASEELRRLGRASSPVFDSESDDYDDEGAPRRQEPPAPPPVEPTYQNLSALRFTPENTTFIGQVRIVVDANGEVQWENDFYPEQPRVAQESRSRRPSTPYSRSRRPSTPHSPSMSPSAPYSRPISPAAPHSRPMSPSTPYSPSMSPSAPHPRSRRPSTPHSPSMSPSAPHPRSRRPSTPHSPSMSPSVPHPRSRRPSTPHSPSMSPSAPHPRSRRPSTPHSPSMSPSAPHPRSRSLSTPYSPSMSPSAPHYRPISPAAPHSRPMSPSTPYSPSMSPLAPHSPLMSPSAPHSRPMSPSAPHSPLMSPSAPHYRPMSPSAPVYRSGSNGDSDGDDDERSPEEDGNDHGRLPRRQEPPANLLNRPIHEIQSAEVGTRGNRHVAPRESSRSGSNDDSDGDDDERLPEEDGSDHGRLSRRQDPPASLLHRPIHEGQIGTRVNRHVAPGESSRSGINGAPAPASNELEESEPAREFKRKLMAIEKEHDAFWLEKKKEAEALSKAANEIHLQRVATWKTKLALEKDEVARLKKQREESARIEEVERKAREKLHLRKMADMRQKAIIEKEAEDDAHKARLAAINAEKELSEERKRLADGKLQAARASRLQIPQPPIQTQAPPAQVPGAAVPSRICSNCQTRQSQYWKNINSPKILCNQCYSYRQRHKKHRPF